MDNSIKTLEIKNFKSIKHLQLDCKRVNVIIGKPNVGKSNILEALGLFSVNYTFSKKYLSEFIRYENIANLFFENDYSKSIEISTDKFLMLMSYSEEENIFLQTIIDNKSNTPNFVKNSKKELIYAKGIYNNGAILKSKSKTHDTTSKLDFVKKYHFEKLAKFEKNSNFSLKPPFGINLFSIIHHHKNILADIGNILENYGFEFVLDMQEQRFEIQKREKNYVFKYPYLSIADTLQRYFFHLAAIESNKNSVLIFEEPEAHSYPPYIWNLANKIALDADNQYFIATHSPYMIETLMQELKDDDINIWVTYFENYETKVRALSPNELQEMYDLGGDIFFNMDKFEKLTDTVE
jgi:AAA15 family ATPase/GTPase